jgi:hypothetical protein
LPPLKLAIELITRQWLSVSIPLGLLLRTMQSSTSEFESTRIRA